jgi:hypothetical protein
MPTVRSILVDSRLKPKEKLTALAICALGDHTYCPSRALGSMTGLSKTQVRGH